MPKYDSKGSPAADQQRYLSENSKNNVLIPKYSNSNPLQQATQPAIMISGPQLGRASMPTGRKKPDTLNVPGAPLRYSQISKPIAQGTSDALLPPEPSSLRLGDSSTKGANNEHVSQQSFSGHSGDILRLRQQQPSAARRRDIPYFRNSAVS